VTTNGSGDAAVPVSLNVGTYSVLIKDLESGINKTNTVDVVKTIKDNKDIVKYYKGSQTYSVLVMGDNNEHVGAGEVVKMTINKKTYSVKTDKTGHAILKLNFAPKKYTITAKYKNFTVSNKITIKSTLVTKNISKKRAKTIKFDAKLLDTKGKVLKNKKVTFKIKGKTYKVKTNKKGIATLKIKSLKVGKYSIVSKYGSLKVKNTITVKK
jgi:hypothetical protein